MIADSFSDRFTVFKSVLQQRFGISMYSIRKQVSVYIWHLNRLCLLWSFLLFTLTIKKSLPHVPVEETWGQSPQSSLSAKIRDLELSQQKHDNFAMQTCSKLPSPSYFNTPPPPFSPLYCQETRRGEKHERWNFSLTLALVHTVSQFVSETHKRTSRSVRLRLGLSAACSELLENAVLPVFSLLSVCTVCVWQCATHCVCVRIESEKEMADCLCMYVC